MTSPPSDTRTDPAPAPVEAPQPLPGGLAAFLVFLSSGAVLVLETVSLRLVGPYVGITLQVTSSVIGLALAAIAYGAWTGGWLADRRDPRRMLAPALILAAIATAVTLPLVRYAGEVLRGAAAPGILLLTGLAVFVPAALLSSITPMVVKLQLGDLKRTGQVVGRLCSIGTLGGITATLGTGFVLVATLPSTVIMVALAVVIGGTGLALGRYLYLRDRTALPGPARTKTVLAVVGLGAAMLSAVAPTPCDVETAYHCAKVQADSERPSGRLLLLNSAHHSFVDLADPTYLRFGVHPVDRRGGRPDGAAGTAVVGGAPRRWRIHHAALPDGHPPGQREPGVRDRRWTGRAGPPQAGRTRRAAAAGGGGRRPGAAGRSPRR